ncbi:hypothetical protein SISSUDRAFT_1131725 [Sistotremastrum suecicum HHB10207 ss-3]|uniref:Uncharacterized protein n=1 Tax=Sistotremastrum suecicum HHB10207 ss-3 TaxID=1314776 RepID=A0A165ZU46_9AGAM|nr:hypothetical protein SISSUDRAFT_1131725 [Sistotremastrum suecicum HHB10207 ss-3]
MEDSQTQEDSQNAVSRYPELFPGQISGNGSQRWGHAGAGNLGMGPQVSQMDMMNLFQTIMGAPSFPGTQTPNTGFTGFNEPYSQSSSHSSGSDRHPGRTDIPMPPSIHELVEMNNKTAEYIQGLTARIDVLESGLKAAAESGPEEQGALVHGRKKKQTPAERRQALYTSSRCFSYLENSERTLQQKEIVRQLRRKLRAELHEIMNHIPGKPFAQAPPEVEPHPRRPNGERVLYPDFTLSVTAPQNTRIQHAAADIVWDEHVQDKTTSIWNYEDDAAPFTKRLLQETV